MITRNEAFELLIQDEKNINTIDGKMIYNYENLKLKNKFKFEKKNSTSLCSTN